MLPLQTSTGRERAVVRRQQIVNGRSVPAVHKVSAGT
jgi:hypothetical protein